MNFFYAKHSCVYVLKVIYTAGRDHLVQNTIVAESGPMIDTPLMVCLCCGDTAISNFKKQ